MLPFLFIILHFSQIGLTDDLTFTAKSSFQKKSDYKYIIEKSNLQANFFKIGKFTYLSKQYVP